MAKNTKSKHKLKGLKLIGLISRALSVLFALMAVLMIFAPAIKMTVGQEVVEYTGWDITFGLTESVVLVGAQQIFVFSFMNLLTYLLASLGALSAILTFLKLGNKKVTFVAVVSLLVAGILFFFAVKFCMPGDNFGTQLGGLLGTNPKQGLTLAMGAIVSGICSILSALAILVKPFLASIK